MSKIGLQDPIMRICMIYKVELALPCMDVNQFTHFSKKHKHVIVVAAHQSDSLLAQLQTLSE